MLDCNSMMTKTLVADELNRLTGLNIDLCLVCAESVLAIIAERQQPTTAAPC